MTSETKMILFAIVSALVLAGLVVFDMKIAQEVSALNPPFEPCLDRESTCIKSFV